VGTDKRVSFTIKWTKIQQHE